MAKDWIKKAIKHPGRCTLGSPNYDCPKGSPQWNLAQRFKHGDLHKKKDGGKVKQLTPEELKWVATSIRGDKSAEYFDGYFPDNTIEGGNVLRIKKLNDDQLEQVKNYMKNTSFFTDVVQALTPNISIFNKKPKNSKLEQGGYAASDNIDIEGYTNPVKYFAARGINISDDDCLECGGKIKANKGINIENTWDNLRSKLSKKDQVKFEEWKSNLPDRLQNDKDYDLKGFFKEFGKNSLPEGYEYHLIDKYKLPNHPSFSSDSQYYNPETEYLGGKWDNGILNWIYTPNTQFKNKIIEPKSMDEVRSDFLNQNHNMLSRSPNMFKKFGGYAEMGFDTNDYYSAIANERPRDSATSYQQDVKGKFNWLNTLSKIPIEQMQKDVDSTPLTKNYMLNRTPKGYFNVYDKNNKPVGYSIDGETLVPQEPNFQDGGLVKAWIQKFTNGGRTNPTTPFTDFPSYENYNNSFVDPASLNQNPFEQQPQVPMAQSNMPQNIGTNYKMDFNASNDEVNKGNAMADSMMGGKKGTGISNPMSMGMDVAGKSMNAAANLMSTFGKDNSKAKAFGLGASGAMKVSDNITKPFESIPIAGKAISAVGKTLGFIIGGALEARRQGIENEEMDKYNKLQEYTSRNTQTAQQPSYYGQYMSKYGSNIKNLEQRLVDDIFSDYDKFMKLT